MMSPPRRSGAVAAADDDDDGGGGKGHHVHGRGKRTTQSLVAVVAFIMLLLLLWYGGSAGVGAGVGDFDHSGAVSSSSSSTGEMATTPAPATLLSMDMVRNRARRAAAVADFKAYLQRKQTSFKTTTADNGVTVYLVSVIYVTPDTVRLLPHFINHYMDLGISESNVQLFFVVPPPMTVATASLLDDFTNDDDDDGESIVTVDMTSDMRDIVAFLKTRGIVPRRVLRGAYALSDVKILIDMWLSASLATLTDTVRARTWVLHADVDELTAYAEPVHVVVAALKPAATATAGGDSNADAARATPSCNVVRGVYMRHFSRACDLRGIDADVTKSLWHQFPLTIEGKGEMHMKTLLYYSSLRVDATHDDVEGRLQSQASLCAGRPYIHHFVFRRGLRWRLALTHRLNVRDTFGWTRWQHMLDMLHKQHGQLPCMHETVY